jgi:hypothetical protein
VHLKLSERRVNNADVRHNRLGKMRGGIFLLVYLAWVAGPNGWAAAGPEQGTVSLGQVASLPGTEVLAPVYFTPSNPQVQVGRLSATVHFENKSVSFLRAEKGIQLDSTKGSFEVKTDEDAKNAGQSILHLQVSAGAGEHFRDGLLIFLRFAIKSDAPEGATITLKLGDIDARDVETPPRPVTPLESKNGTIQVMKPDDVPYTACFFFSH